MAEKFMGYQGKLYYGTAGSTAATQITNARDINYAFSADMGDTTVRGDGSAIPKKYGAPVLLKLDDLSWNMVNKPSDTVLTALRAAAAAQTLIALRTIDNASGTGFDGDVYIDCKLGMPMNGEQTFDFKVTSPSNANREMSLNS